MTNACYVDQLERLDCIYFVGRCFSKQVWGELLIVELSGTQWSSESLAVGDQSLIGFCNSYKVKHL